MNIGLFTDTYFPQINGVGTSVHTLAENLEKLGHNVYIFTASDPHQPDGEKNVIRMPSMPFVFVANFRAGLVYPPKTLIKISHLNLDIVHTQTEFSLGVFGKILSRSKNIPMVHTYHTMYEDYVHYIVNGYLITPVMAKEFSRIFCNSANAVIAPTLKVKNILEDYGVARPISVIPTGISFDAFRKSNFSMEQILALKESIGLNKDAPVILSLGRIAKEKSIDVIINAMPELLKLVPDAILVIVGDGPVKNELEALAFNLGLSENIIFTGSKPWSEIGLYYQLGDVFVSASTTETQGLTFAEAMAGGIIVVAKKDESIEGIIKDNETGFLFETNTDLPKVLFKILSDTTLRKRISQNAILAIEDLSSEVFAKKVETLYTNVIENHTKYDIVRHHHFMDRQRIADKLVELNKELESEIYDTTHMIVSIARLSADTVRKKLNNNIKKEN